MDKQQNNQSSASNSFSQAIHINSVNNENVFSQDEDGSFGGRVLADSHDSTRNWKIVGTVQTVSKLYYFFLFCVITVRIIACESEDEVNETELTPVTVQSCF